MAWIYLVLLSCQAAGEIIHQVLKIPLSGPIVGMIILIVILAIRGGASGEFMNSSQSILRYLSLFFVPPGVGIIQHLPLLRAQWLPLLLGVVVSTVLAMISGAVVMQSVNRLYRTRRMQAPLETSAGGG